MAAKRGKQRQEGGQTDRRETIQARLRTWARGIKQDVHALYLAARDQRVPWYAKAVALLVAGYALSPIDLIPDFVPVLGYLDDLVIVPLGILLAVSLIPPDLLAEHRATAARASQRPRSRTATVVIVAIWLGVGLVVLTVLLDQVGANVFS